jgi:hypothetical protein
VPHPAFLIRSPKPSWLIRPAKPSTSVQCLWNYMDIPFVWFFSIFRHIYGIICDIEIATIVDTWFHQWFCMWVPPWNLVFEDSSLIDNVNNNLLMIMELRTSFWCSPWRKSRTTRRRVSVWDVNYAFMPPQNLVVIYVTRLFHSRSKMWRDLVVLIFKLARSTGDISLPGEMQPASLGFVHIKNDGNASDCIRYYTLCNQN